MNCCEPTIIPFEDTDVLTVPYSEAMLANYGAAPTVFVYHLDKGEYIEVTRTIRTAVVGLPVTEIKVYNGGIATGFLKIMK